MLRIKQNNRKVCLCSIREREKKGLVRRLLGDSTKEDESVNGRGKSGSCSWIAPSALFILFILKDASIPFLAVGDCEERGCFSLYSSSNWRDTRRGIYQPENKRWKKTSAKIKRNRKEWFKNPRNVDFCAWNNPSLYVNGPMMMCC